jgi:hypothetical protein
MGLAQLTFWNSHHGHICMDAFQCVYVGAVQDSKNQRTVCHSPCVDIDGAFRPYVFEYELSTRFAV